MRKEVKRELDKWYSEYCKENHKAPTWGELVDKEKEIASKHE